MVHFYVKSEEKCQIVVQHEKLAEKKDVESMRKFWKVELEKLKTKL